MTADTPSLPHHLTIPSRGVLSRTPLATSRLVLGPIDGSARGEIWDAIDNSRWHLERWLPWVPFNNTLEASARFAEACAADWDAGRALRFGLRLRATNKLIGLVGLDSCVHLHRSCELGYWLSRDAIGQGLMTEGAQAVVDFAFRRMGLHRMRCAAATDNYPSLRVIARLGFRFEGIARQAEYVGARWLDHAVFAKLATDADLAAPAT